MPANTVAPTSILQTYDGRLFGRSVANDIVPAPGRPFNMNCVVAKGASSGIALVTMQVVDRDGVAVAGVYNFDWWLSDDATYGAGLTATTASGAVGAGAEGTDLVVYVAKKATRSQTNSSGQYQLSITDTAKTAFNVVVDFKMGFHHPTQVLATLAAGDYD